jgi:hypothetical protein
MASNETTGKLNIKALIEKGGEAEEGEISFMDLKRLQKQFCGICKEAKGILISQLQMPGMLFIHLLVGML